MRVIKDLHLDMPRALDQLFEVDLVLAEGTLGLAFALGHLADEIGFGADGGHTASAAAPGSLEHDRIADPGRETLVLFFVIRHRIGCRHVGRPTSMARLRAASLLPTWRIGSGQGPMKVMPFPAQASASSGFSESSP